MTDIDELEQHESVSQRFADALERFRLAVSWGGYESLALPAVAKPG